MASSFKRKKKPLPKFTNGSIYSDANTNNMANARIDDRGRSSAGDYSMMDGGAGARMGESSGDMMGTAGVQSAEGGSGMMSNMNKMSIFGAVEAGAKGLTNQENAQYTDGAQGGMNSNLEKQAGQILPWMGMATALRDMGQSYLGRDEQGNLQGTGNKVAGEWSTADHTQMLKYAQKGDAWGVVRESAGVGKIGRTVSHIAGKGKEESGGWGKFNKAMGMEKDKVAVDPNLAIKQQAEMADIANKNKYGTFRQGGMSYPTNAIPIHGGNWAVPTFPNGGINAEVEKQENTIAPNGEFTQFDGPSHEQGGIKTSLEPGELIFSDKLKPIGTKKTFAQLNKSNNTNKEQKILDDPKSSNISKKSAQLNLMAKQADSMKLFQAQESLKMSKLNSYTKRLGGIQKYPDGGVQTDPVRPAGSNLMATVKLNQDPSQLPQGLNYSAYNQFQKYLTSKDFVKDPRMNTIEGKKAYTDELINDFNTNSEYAKKFPQNKITPDYVKAVQEYHKKSDPNVVVDGWVGSQTSQMNFPVPTVNFGNTDPKTRKPVDTSKPYNVTWGNKQYTLPPDKWNNYTTKDFVPVNRYGGVQKFEEGDMFGYTPTTLAEKYKMQQAAQNMALYNKNNASIYNQEADPNAGSANWQDMNSSEFKKDSQDMLARAQEAAKTDQSNSNMNWKDGAFNAGMLLANSAGPIAYLAGEGKKYDKQDFYEYKPETLDPTASLRDVDMANKAAAYDLANRTSGNAGNYLTNRTVLSGMGALNKDKIRREFGNINAQIKNQGQQYNIGNKYMTDDITARNKGKALTNYYKSIGQLGTNTAQAGRDYKSTERDNQQIQMMNDFFQNYSFDKSTNSWKFKNK